MKASRFSDAQHAFILKQGDEEVPVVEICRKAGIGHATYFNWKKKHAGLLPDEMRRSGNVWDNAAMESFFSSLKTERTARKVYKTRDDAKADVFHYIERFYNPKRRHSTLGYLSPMEFENNVGLA